MDEATIVAKLVKVATWLTDPDRVVSHVGSRGTTPRVFPRRVFYSAGHPANRNPRIIRARGPAGVATLDRRELYVTAQSYRIVVTASVAPVTESTRSKLTDGQVMVRRLRYPDAYLSRTDVRG